MAIRRFEAAHRRIAGVSFLGLGALMVPLALVAQPVLVPPVVTAHLPAQHEGRQAAEWPLLIATPFAGALGAHMLGSPDGWARTWGGYGKRLGDQVGFLVIEEGVRRVLISVLPPTAPRASCWQAERSAARNLTIGAGCALASTVAVRPASGTGWRFNAPVTVSLLAATGTSLAWRPERADASKARSFLLTRTAVVFGGMAAARLFDDWRGRHRAGDRR